MAVSERIQVRKNADSAPSVTHVPCHLKRLPICCNEDRGAPALLVLFPSRPDTRALPMQWDSHLTRKPSSGAKWATHRHSDRMAAAVLKAVSDEAYLAERHVGLRIRSLVYV